MKLLFSFLLWIFSIFIFECESAITDQSISSTNGTLLFRVYESNKVNIANSHRTVASQLKLSFGGGGGTTTIDSIVSKSPNTSWILTLSDKSTVELTIAEKSNQTTEFVLNWHGSDPARELCFHYGHNQASWYSTYNAKRPKWPMDTTHDVPKTLFNYLLHDYWLNDEFKRVNELIYYNSDGFGIALDPAKPWFMHRTAKPELVLCFSVNSTHPYQEENLDPSYLDIKIHLFASTNIRTVIDYVVHHSGLLPVPKSIPSEKMFLEPSWMQWSQVDRHQAGILNFTHELEKRNLSKGEIFVAPMSLNSDLSPSTELFNHFATMIEDLHKRSYRLGYTFFISGYDYEWAVHRLDDANGTHYSVPFQDFSDPKVKEWFEGSLTKQVKDKHLDSLILYNYFGTPVRNFTDPSVTGSPNQLITKYVESMSSAAGPSIYSFIAYRTQHLPVFVQTWNDEFVAEEHFKALIPNVLALSIVGYSFISANPAGTPSDLNEEMYIRWVQATALLPHQAFYQVPWKTSEKCANMTKKFIDLHSAHAQTIVELAKKRLLDGSPIVRPLWYVAPDDPKTYPIADQFMLGDDILVAPVLVEKQVERTVYFPIGNWIDQHGKSWSGPAEFKVAAPLEELPYFKRKV